MLDKIKDLERKARALEPSVEEFKTMLDETAEHLAQFLSQNGTDPVKFLTNDISNRF